MQRNHLFSRTRSRLAFSYAIAMVIILAVAGVAMYWMVCTTLMASAEKELESFAGIFQGEVQPHLEEPAILSKKALTDVPYLCLSASSTCRSSVQSAKSAPMVEGYYLQLFDLQGHLLAQSSTKYTFVLNRMNKGIQQIISPQTPKHLQLAKLLQTGGQKDWGYLQVSRSLEDVDRNLRELRWILILSLPIAWASIVIVSWLLAGFAMAPIYRSYQHIQQFTADAAHELRTPLAATQATVESTLLQPQPSWAQLQDVLGIIQRQNHRLIQLVSDLLLLSQIDLSAYGGRKTGMTQDWEACCLNNIVADLDEELAAMAIAADIEFNTIANVNHALWVWGNSEQLYRLVMNLIVNAMKYTPAQGRVTVFLRQRNRMAVIQVQDTGVGIDAKSQRRIFDRFYRVYENRSRHDGGSGLGLAIVKSIATLHRGRLTVQSKVGEGSTFTLELPKLALHHKQAKKKMMKKKR
jgi:signal transduction histidine kinase